MVDVHTYICFLLKLHPKDSKQVFKKLLHETIKIKEEIEETRV